MSKLPISISGEDNIRAFLLNKRFEVVREGKITPEALQWAAEVRRMYCPQIAGLDQNGNFFMDCLNTMPWYWYYDTMGGQR